MRFTSDEQMLVMLYSPGTRLGLITELSEMKQQLTPGERKLKRVTESLLLKLNDLSDDEFEAIDFFPD